jgi:hypothetical protein
MIPVWAHILASQGRRHLFCDPLGSADLDLGRQKLGAKKREKLFKNHVFKSWTASPESWKFYKRGPEKKMYFFHLKLDFFPIFGYDKPGSEPAIRYFNEIS